MKSNKFVSSRMGFLYLFLYNLLSALQGVLLSDLFQQQSVFSFLLFNFSLLTAVAWGIAFIKQQWSEFRQLTFLNLVWLNLLTLVSWISYYLALKYIEPAIEAAIGCAVPAIVTFLVLFWRHQEKREKKELIAIGGLLGGSLILVMTLLAGESGVNLYSMPFVYIGMTMAFVCGVSVALYNLYSKKLSQRGVAPNTILCVRFPLLLLVAYLYSPSPELQSILLGDQLGTYLILALVGTILPLIFLQHGIARLEPMQVGFMMGWLPAFFFISQMMASNIAFSGWTLAGVIIVVISLLIVPVSQLCSLWKGGSKRNAGG